MKDGAKEAPIVGAKNQKREGVYVKSNYWRLIIVIIVFLLIGIIAYKNSIHSIVFQSKRWIEAREKESWETRKLMAQYLIEKNLLIGKSKDEIYHLLGKPENFSDVPKNELYYTIDLYFGMDIDPVRDEELIIQLNSENHVIKAFRKKTLDN